MIPLLTRLDRGAALLREWRDVLEERVADDAAPAWAVTRGWDAFLLALDDDDLGRCERDMAALTSLPGAPDELAALAREAALVAAVADATLEAETHDALRGAPLRKSGQVAALVDLCRARGFAPRRVVDVGAGAGHLTRALARALGVPAVGLERDAERVARARARAGAGDAGARFEAVAVAPASLALAPGDLAVGLHACGALGDALVEVAARDGADLVLVACCPQKVAGAQRAAVSRSGRDLGLTIARELLGLANSHEGAIDLDARAVRVALRRLLRARGVVVRAGEETRGLTPRTARTLPVAAERVLSRRGLAPASPTEQEQALALARGDLAIARRRSLPRRLLGPALEVTLALDRARALEEAGAAAEVLRLFPRALSPRNLAVVARGCHGGRP